MPQRSCPSPRYARNHNMPELCFALFVKLLGEWVASSPLARPRWSEATEVGYPSLICKRRR